MRITAIPPTALGVETAAIVDILSLPKKTTAYMQYNNDYVYPLRRTLLKKGLSSNSSPKTFVFVYSPIKVFGKGLGEEPFLRKVFPDKYA
jgi:hypothetical protein